MRVAIVLTEFQQALFSAVAVNRWRQLYPDAMIVRACNDDLPAIEIPGTTRVWSGSNPGYYAATDRLHGHHQNLNAGVAAALRHGKWDSLITCCADIAPRTKHAGLLVEDFVASGKPIGITRADWADEMNVAITRYQDDLMMFTRKGARDMFPVRRYPNVFAYYSEISLGAHMETLTCPVHLFEDMSERFRYYWYERHGFAHMGNRWTHE